MNSRPLSHIKRGFFAVLLLSWLFCLSCMSWLAPALSHAGCLDASWQEQMLSLINEARTAPAAMAERVGLDPEQIVSERPELAEIFEKGLPPVVSNPQLFLAAQAHTADMVDAGYYSHISPDGLEPTDRVREAGYVPAVVREGLGKVVFSNYMDAGEAVWNLFSNMYYNELTNPDEGLTILDPQVEEAGICVQPAIEVIQGIPFNVYVVTCDLALSAISRCSSLIFALINEARANPLAVAERLGMDRDELLEKRPDIADILINGLPPLRWDQRLFDAGWAHGWDMLQRGYLSHVNPEGLGVWERLAEAGYHASAAGESYKLLVLQDDGFPFCWDGAFDPEAGPVAAPSEPCQDVNDNDPDGNDSGSGLAEADDEGYSSHLCAMANYLFNRMFRKELASGSAELVILNPEFRDTGAALVVAQPGDLDPEQSGFAGYFNYLLILEFGSLAEEPAG